MAGAGAALVVVIFFFVIFVPLWFVPMLKAFLAGLTMGRLLEPSLEDLTGPAAHGSRGHG